MAHANPPLNVLEILDGIRFPVTVPEIVQYAQEHDASEDVLDELQVMPDRIYTSIQDINKGLGSIEDLPGHENQWSSEPSSDLPQDDINQLPDFITRRH